MLEMIMCFVNEICYDCGKHLRWMSKNWSDEDLGNFYSEGLCPRCRNKE